MPLTLQVIINVLKKLEAKLDKRRKERAAKKQAKFDKKVREKRWKDIKKAKRMTEPNRYRETEQLKITPIANQNTNTLLTADESVHSASDAVFSKFYSKYPPVAQRPSLSDIAKVKAAYKFYRIEDQL